MEEQSFQNHSKNHAKIEVGKRTAQNREKSRPGAPKGRKCRCECPASGAFLARGPPPEGLKDRGLDSRDPTRRWTVGLANLLFVSRYF